MHVERPLHACKYVQVGSTEASSGHHLQFPPPPLPLRLPQPCHTCSVVTSSLLRALTPRRLARLSLCPSRHASCPHVAETGTTSNMPPLAGPMLDHSPSAARARLLALPWCVAVVAIVATTPAIADAPSTRCRCALRALHSRVAWTGLRRARARYNMGRSGALSHVFLRSFQKAGHSGQTSDHSSDYYSLPSLTPRHPPPRLVRHV